MRQLTLNMDQKNYLIKKNILGESTLKNNQNKQKMNQNNQKIIKIHQKREFGARGRARPPAPGAGGLGAWGPGTRAGPFLMYFDYVLIILIHFLFILIILRVLSPIFFLNQIIFLIHVQGYFLRPCNFQSIPRTERVLHKAGWHQPA